MDWLSWLLSLVVVLYVGIYAKKTIESILRYKNNKIHLESIKGIVDSKIEEEKKAYDGVLISLSYPLYKYIVDGKSRYLQSTVKYRDINIGEEVEIFFNKESGEAWAKNDIPLMKRQLIIRVSLITAITIIMILVSIWL